ncbi:hypothetical protein CLOM621_05742 [Clostridium sp. M62/1]|nr:hypothetical protein CLOM621_05742 [Clostridium sp. M62/1]
MLSFADFFKRTTKKPGAQPAPGGEGTADLYNILIFSVLDLWGDGHYNGIE